MFRKFWLDTILGTLFIFAFMGLIANISSLKVFDLFDPVGDAFADMETTDIVFSQMRDQPNADEDVLLVNMGTMPRIGIAEMINIINAHNPKVIGLDSFFYSPKDSLGDALLAEALANVDNLVMATKLLYSEEADAFDSLGLSNPLFIENSAMGFVNLITGAQSQDDLKVCRSFTPKERVAGNMQFAFAVKLASYLDPEKARRFLERNNEVEVINYRGNVLDYGATRYGTRYYALDVEDVFTENYIPELINDKIVIFCYLGDFLGDRQALEDKFFTPLNVKYAGKASLDMFGGVIHANIISMVLDEDYIDGMDSSTAWILAILAGYFNVVLFSWVYKRIPRWYDGLTKLIQLMQLLVLGLLILYVFDTYNYKLDMTFVLIVIALSGDVLEVYYGVVKNTFTREGRRELAKMNKM